MRNFFLLIAGMASLYVVGCLQTSVNGVEWYTFKQEYRKQYKSINEDIERRSLYARNKLQTEDFNGKKSIKLGYSRSINQFSDWKLEKEKLLANSPLPIFSHPNKRFNSIEANMLLESILKDDSPLPDEFDWRNETGRVSKPKNQGTCVADWAFAAIGSLEGQEKSMNANLSKLVELSVQQVIDCTENERHCFGGQPDHALEFITRLGGVQDEKSYPFEAKQDHCRFHSDKKVFQNTGIAYLPLFDEEALKKVVARYGPVVVAFEVPELFEAGFTQYRRGVYLNDNCHNSPDDLWLNRYGLIVGYGVHPVYGDYWIMKYSYGEKWGYGGYIYFIRNYRNHCGIATRALIPIVSKE